MVVDGTRSTAAYSRFAEEMDIGSDAVEVNTRGEPEEKGKLGFVKSCLLTRWKLWGIIVLCILSFLLGFLLTHIIVKSCVIEPGTTPSATERPGNSNNTDNTSDHQGEGRKYSASLSSDIRIENFKRCLKQFTEHNGSKLHDSGSDGSKFDGDTIKRTWAAQDFEVTTKSYTVQLTRPNMTESSSLVISGDGDEPIVFTPSNKLQGNNLLPPFIVNSPAAVIEQAIPMFINYGRADDFAYLVEEGMRSIEGRVCVFKLGMVQLPILVQRCAEHGGKGVIAFPDPADYLNGQAYPNGNGLPPDAVIRDNISPLFGDPLTPTLPSSDGVTDSTEYNITLLPTMIISAEFAATMLSLMRNPPVPSHWLGRLQKEGLTAEEIYHVSGEGTGFQRDQRMKMTIRNVKVSREITNVFGMVRGSIEPDRYVIFGCHRDSLTPGAVEPGTGMAVFMELSRLVRQLRLDGWSPRRTIIFANWDGGDDGHIGSTEWVEENSEILSQRAVVYVNLDEAISGQYSFAAEGSAILAKAVSQAMKEVDSPDQDSDGKTVFDNWKIKNQQYQGDDYQLRPLGVNSDATPFLHFAGVPSIDLKYTFSKSGKHIPRYPLWHTSLDTVSYVEDFIDSGWERHRAMTEIAGRLLLMYADDIVLPVDVTDYATTIEYYYNQLMEVYSDIIDMGNLREAITKLGEAIANLKTAAEKFHSEFIVKVDVKDEIQVREANDRLVAMERAFLSHDGTSHMYPQLRHMIYGPSSIGAYDAEGLSPLGYALSLANASSTFSNSDKMFDNAKTVLSVTIVAINKATNALLVDDLFA